MSYKIDAGVPFPRVQRAKQSKYPWDELKIGESFKIPIEDFTGKLTGKAGALAREAKEYGIAVRVRAVVGVTSEGEVHVTAAKATREDCSGLRVWRVAKFPAPKPAEEPEDDDEGDVGF